MKSDGSGLAPALGAEPEPGYTSARYDKQTSFGGPCYSKKNKEIYMFGGGHRATTVNALSRWNLNKSSPDMTLMCAPTTSAIRTSNWNSEYILNQSGGYWPDGKPFSPHAYRGSQYFDSADEFVQVGLQDCQIPTSAGDNLGFGTVPSFVRGQQTWRSTNRFGSVPGAAVGSGGNTINAVIFTNWAQSKVYFYANRFGDPAWHTLAPSVGWTNVGGTGYHYYSQSGAASARGAARHDQDVALLIGGAQNGPETGWRAKMIDLTTCLMTNWTVTGAAWPGYPNGLMLHDLAWVSQHGYWVAWFVGSNSDNEGIGTQKVVKLTITGTTQLTATEMTLAGTALTQSGGNTRGMFYEPDWNCLIFVGGMSENLRAVRLE